MNDEFVYKERAPRIGSHQRKILAALYNERNNRLHGMVLRRDLWKTIYGTEYPTQSQRSSFSRAVVRMENIYNDVCDTLPSLIEKYPDYRTVTMPHDEFEVLFDFALEYNTYRITDEGIKRFEALPAPRGNSTRKPVGGPGALKGNREQRMLKALGAERVRIAEIEAR